MSGFLAFAQLEEAQGGSQSVPWRGKPLLSATGSARLLHGDFAALSILEIAFPPGVPTNTHKAHSTYLHSPLWCALSLLPVANTAAIRGDWCRSKNDVPLGAVLQGSIRAHHDTLPAAQEKRRMLGRNTKRNMSQIEEPEGVQGMEGQFDDAEEPATDDKADGHVDDSAGTRDAVADTDEQTGDDDAIQSNPAPSCCLTSSNDSVT